VREGNRLFRNHQTQSNEGTRSGTVVPFRAHRRSSLVAGHARRDDDAPTSGAGPASATARALLKDDELSAIEKTFEHGITAVQIVDAFTSRGIKFSEASFRKYVQQGLLPRSRRVGRKGKHRGSLGVYPSKTVRRINTVKELMADGYTIEEIQGQFLLYTDLVEGVAENLAELCTRLQTDLAGADPAQKKELERELADTRRDGDRVVARLETLTRRVAAPRTDNLRLAGAAGGAEDLL
jgi:DNA-binding transcriptional MerR regulator